ncbi:MAG: hypothetical protein HC892_04045 [Saprospiraceae bacterium]|nr:hypothetical protein [Saprospiraceae bacterium]
MIRLVAAIMSIVFFFLFTNCQNLSEYDQMVKRELAKGIRQDSLFLGFYFGMPSKSFYDHCWKLNKQQIVKEGKNNTTVEYDVSKDLRHSGKMNFYPDFFEDKIYEIPISFNYDAFAWSQEFSNDTLLVDVLQLLQKQYGDFKEFTHPKKGSVFVNVNGNRQIRIFTNDMDNSVRAVFTDLTVDKNQVKAAQTSSKSN